MVGTSFGQNRDVPFYTTKNFLSYKLGVGYPLFSRSADNPAYVYSFSDKTFNYAISGGLELGHFFGKNFSIGIAPSFMYTNFSKFNFHYANYQWSYLAKELYGTARLSHWSILIPVNFAFLISDNLDVSTGFFFLKPIVDRLHSNGIWTDYSYDPPKVLQDLERNYKNRRSFFRGGLHFQVSYLIKARDWKQKKINIEYYHSFTQASYNAYEKWLMISFKKVFYK